MTQGELSWGLRGGSTPVSGGWASFSGCPVGCSALYIPAAALDQWSLMGDMLSCVFLLFSLLVLHLSGGGEGFVKGRGGSVGGEG